ncbi:MAG: prepilin-type N-terminal cleavage/methylation domain-containing protein, partial [Bacilli bacterium]
MNKHKGFTLVELLAVIVILAIILAVAIPGIG